MTKKAEVSIHTARLVPIHSSQKTKKENKKMNKKREKKTKKNRTFANYKVANKITQE